MRAIDSMSGAKIKAHFEVFIENMVQHYEDRVIPTLAEPAKYLAKPSTAGRKRVSEGPSSILLGYR